MKKFAFPSRLTKISGLLVVVQLCFSISLGNRGPMYDVTVTWVRGRVQIQGKPKSAASKIKVTLVPSAHKNDESRAVVTYTRENGWFDFKVPAGSYVLKVWLSEKESKTYLIKVRAQKYFDVVIVVPNRA